jgi:hypothetical protein
MIDWMPFDRESPPPDGQYLVYCVAPQWDSEWVDAARITNGQWKGFRGDLSHHERVRYFAVLNYPTTD